MEIELPKFDNKVDFWKTELKTYEEILQKKPAEFKKDLENIQTYRRLFLKKIGIAFIGPTKAGKSRFLNAMIGTDYLQSADQNCTFFGLKIQPTTAEPAVLFTDPSKKNTEGFQGEEAIKKQIKQINFSERDNTKSDVLEIEHEVLKKVWTLQTPIKAFLRNGNYIIRREAYTFLELFDLPGISDDMLKWSIDDISKNFEKFAKYEKKNGLEDVEKLKFTEIVRKLNIDIIVMVLDATDIPHIKEFFAYFNKSLFRGKQRAHFKEIVQKNRLLIVLNKVDAIGKDGNSDQEIKEEKNQIIQRIFEAFLLNDNLNSEFSKEKVSSNDKLFEQFKTNHKITFVSANKAFDNMVFSESKIEKIKTCFKNKTNDIIKKEIEEARKINEKNEKYHVDSGFEEFLKNLNETIHTVFQEKIENEIEINLNYLKQVKSIFDDLFSCFKDNEQGELKSNFKDIEKTMLAYKKQNEVSFDTEKEQINIEFKEIFKNYSKNTKDIKSNYYVFVQDCFLLIKGSKEKIYASYSAYINKVLSLFPNHPELQKAFKAKLDYSLNQIIRKKDKRFDKILFSFLPDDINYYRIWFVWKIVSTFVEKGSFERKWKVFLSTYYDRLNKKIIDNIEKDYKAEFTQDLVEVTKDSWNLIKIVNDLK